MAKKKQAEAEGLEAMMAQLAAEAVEVGRQSGVTLDYSEASLERVEKVLDVLAGQAKSAESEDLDALSKMWGAYFGEVVRRRWGGEWSIETYPGAHFATLTLTIHGSKLFPSMKVYRRLTNGKPDDVWAFYKEIEQRLKKQPGPRVH